MKWRVLCGSAGNKSFLGHPRKKIYDHSLVRPLENYFLSRRKRIFRNIFHGLPLTKMHIAGVRIV